MLEEGHEVNILDINALGLSDAAVIDYISSASFDVAAISALSTQYRYVKWLASQIKKKDKRRKIILGWVLATHSSQAVLRNTDVDICVIGEGENTVKELLSNLENPSDVKGIMYKDGTTITLNPSRKYIEELDTLPMIPYDLFPVDAYIDSLSRTASPRERAINIICGRGCPYNCSFCSKTFSGVRLRSIEKVIEEIKYLQSKYAIERIIFADELLAINKKRVLELCEAIAPLQISWSCQGRINLVDEKLLRGMKDAGCTAIGYGVESGSQAILDRMNKKIDIAKAVEIINLTKRIGLIPVLQFIFGYPGENRETIRETIDFFRKIDEPSIEFSPLTPLPGTDIWQYSVQEKLITDEAAFLERLEGGYMPDAPTLANFTSFSDRELVRLRKWSEKQIRFNYIRRHPFYVLGKIRDKLLASAGGN